MSVGAVVVGAGSGSRYGGRKQFQSLHGRPVVVWAIEGARSVSDHVVLVVPGDVAGEAFEGADTVVAGGATRSASVRAGLASLPADIDVVVVHDAARPLAQPRLFADVVAAVQAGADAAVPGVPLADTVKRVSGGAVVETLARHELVGVQTPQAFRAAVLRRAHDRVPEATDDATLVEAAGGKVVVVPGDSRNLKLTTATDLAVARALLGE